MLWELLVGGATFLVAVYLWLTWHFDYWKKNGVIHIKPSIPFGNQWDLLLAKKSVSDFWENFYWKHPDEPAIGVFKLRTPQLLVRHPDLVKTVLIKEFNNFHDNDFYVDPDFDPVLGNNPFITTGERWKTSRAIHTPALTTMKLKTMIPLMANVCRDMTNYINKNLDTPMEAKYFAGQYTIDVVASCVYGLSTDSFKDPDSQFRKMALKVFQSGTTVFISLLLAQTAPWIAKLMNFKLIPNDVTQFFRGAITDAMKHRKANGIVRNDFLQFLISQESENKGYSDDEKLAFAMTFFFDGYETSSVLISYVLYNLACYPEVQERLRAEINDAFPNIDSVDFETLSTLPYLDAVIMESLRLYPPGSTLTKLCTKDTVLSCEGRSYPMRRGMTVTLPIFSIHRDASVFPEPELFDPDRFYKKPTPEGFFPFGLGPRACLGQRFALTQTKMAVCSLVQSFEVLLKDYPPKRLQFDRMVGVFLIPLGGLWIRFRPLDSH